MRQPKPGFGLRVERFITDTLAQLREAARPARWAVGRGRLASLMRSAASRPALIVTGAQCFMCSGSLGSCQDRRWARRLGPAGQGDRRGVLEAWNTYLLCARRQPGTRISRVVDDKCVLGTSTIVPPRPVIAMRGSRFFGQLRSACIFSLLSFSSSLLAP